MVALATLAADTFSRGGELYGDMQKHQSNLEDIWGEFQDMQSDQEK